MEMTLDQYILNPALKTNAILNAMTREMIKKTYQSKFDNIMVRENGKITYHLFYGDNGIYWAYFKVPSEVVHNFYYDVIFKFTPTKSGAILDDLFRYNVKFFSNDPNFVFTFAYVFKQNDLFIDELASKMGKEPLTQKPDEKNPTEQISYEKDLYFAYLIMKSRRLNRLGRFKAEATKLDPKFLLNNVMNASEKINLRQEEGKAYSGKKKAVISKTVAKNISKISGNTDFSHSNVRVTTKTKFTKYSKANKTTKITNKK